MDVYDDDDVFIVGCAIAVDDIVVVDDDAVC